MSPIWPQAVLEELAERVDGKLVVFLGGVDTGKSTLIRELYELLGGEVEIVDGDLGQSTIGPPTCISRGDYEEVRESYFVGDISPRGNLLPVVVGMKLLVERARRPCLVDTDGYIDGNAARAYKGELLNLLQPEVLVLLQRGGELDYFKLYRRKGVEVVELQVAHRGEKAREERIRAREMAFRRYFSQAELRRWPLTGLRFERDLLGHGEPLNVKELEGLLGYQVIAGWRLGRGATVIVEGGRERGSPSSYGVGFSKAKAALGLDFLNLVSAHSLCGLLVGCLAEGKLAGLGIIKGVHARTGAGELEVLTPAKEAQVLQLGRLRLDEEGRHLRLRGGGGGAEFGSDWG